LELGKEEEGFLLKEIYFTHFTCLADIYCGSSENEMAWWHKVCKREISLFPLLITPVSGGR